jgi:hypothetical protein
MTFGHIGYTFAAFTLDRHGDPYQTTGMRSCVLETPQPIHRDFETGYEYGIRRDRPHSPVKQFRGTTEASSVTLLEVQSSGHIAEVCEVGNRN